MQVKRDFVPVTITLENSSDHQMLTKVLSKFLRHESRECFTILSRAIKSPESSFADTLLKQLQYNHTTY